jgi:DMSO/TMAO reductase YedYZ molybdopterin-dependent catalytic subunit
MNQQARRTECRDMDSTSDTRNDVAELRRTPAALVGMLAVAVAVAVGHLIGSFVGDGASPYVAVANAVVKLTGGSLKEFAVQTFGTADKPLLLIGIGVLLLIVGVLAGLVSRRDPSRGALLVAVLGGVGLLAVVFTIGPSLLALLAPVLSIAAGVGAFRWLHRLALRRPAPQGTFDVGEPNRRRFLVASTGTAVGAIAFAGAGELIGDATGAGGSRSSIGTLTPARQAGPIPAGADFARDGTPTFITPNSTFYRVDTAITVPQINADDWQLRIHGMVERERTYSFADIRNRNLVERPVTMTCVSNEVGGPYISTARFIGVPLRELLEEAGVHESAQQLFSTSDDGYTAGTPIEVALERTLLAIGMNGEPLPLEHGFPARMVTPGLYGYVSATKWVVDMELTTFDAKQGYWIPKGYSVRAPIKTQSRIDKPGPFEQVQKGRVVVAGIAWAQPKGIEKVEVQVDDGKWQPAELSTEVSGDTWRMWRTELDLAPGLHSVRSRATDNTGYTQTDIPASPIPDGATGWPSVQFSVNG